MEKVQNLVYGFDLDQNASYRNYMEDELFIKKDDQNRYLLFGVFDGHGGFYVSKQLKEILPKHLEELINKDQIINPQLMNAKLSICFSFVTFLKKCSQIGFIQIDETLKEDQQAIECGSTAIVGVLYPNPTQQNQLLLNIANIGDSSAYLFDNKLGYRLSYEHKASDKKEKERIEQSTGQIFFDRVQGVLAITRAFGDFALKKFGITAEPFLWPEPIEVKNQYSFLIVASDGIWDSYTNQQRLSQMANQLQEMKEKQLNCTDIAKYFLNEAKQCGSRDNLSIIVIKLQ